MGKVFSSARRKIINIDADARAIKHLEKQQQQRNVIKPTRRKEVADEELVDRLKDIYVNDGRSRIISGNHSTEYEQRLNIKLPLRYQSKNESVKENKLSLEKLDEMLNEYGREVNWDDDSLKQLSKSYKIDENLLGNVVKYFEIMNEKKPEEIWTNEEIMNINKKKQIN
ncbi:hypothetical protein SNEBB_002857 [Seison nebaliae]|nr:hypothetical protein SNEBB_002857 [Seison nebaliae]